MKKLIFFPILIIFLFSGCVNLERNYKPAGFNSTSEVKPYLPHYLYFAKQLTADDWNDFYKMFPEYWNDIQTAKAIGSTIEYHPWYVAYAMRWITINKKVQHWDKTTLTRLKSKNIKKGDDIFKIIYSLSPPDRLLWDNDFEILLYESEPNSIQIVNGVAYDIKKCNGCWEKKREVRHNAMELKITGFTDDDVLRILKLKRPTY